MLQSLTFRAYPGGREVRRHRLHALALHRQQQPGAVAAKRSYSIGVAKLLRNQCHVFLKAFSGITHLRGSLTKQFKM